ncbi:MAG: hypothetical protein OXK81_08690 [Chloroflexota bacterium]|nr:hypothetical protein [Chloroflexota bacterium]MDE2930878.1 hypothetical protein [Chloroflexota bacterium]
MIVRIATVGQYRLDDAIASDLQRFDDAMEQAVSGSDNEAFQELLQQMHDLVTERGTALTDDEIVPSDVILPPPDETLEEAQKLLGAEGFVPGRSD